MEDEFKQMAAKVLSELEITIQNIRISAGNELEKPDSAHFWRGSLAATMSIYGELKKVFDEFQAKLDE